MDAGPVGLDRIERFAAGLDHPEGITVTIDGRIFVGGEAGQIYRIEDDDTFTEVANTGGFILGIAADAAGRIYAADTVHHCVWRIVPGTGSHEVYAKGPPQRPLKTPNWGAFDGAGNLYLTDSGAWEAADGLIWRIRPGSAPEVWTESGRRLPERVRRGAGRRLSVLRREPCRRHLPDRHRCRRLRRGAHRALRARPGRARRGRHHRRRRPL